MRLRLLVAAVLPVWSVLLFAACGDDDPAPAGAPDAGRDARGDALATSDGTSTADTFLPDTSRPEASVPDSGTPDADAATADADADADARAPDADAGPTNFCALLTPQPSFCEDFDLGEPVTGQREVEPGGAIARDGTLASSAPSSFRFASATSTGLGDERRTMFKLLAPPIANPTRFTVTFAYRPEAETPTVDAGQLKPRLAIAEVILSATHSVTLDLSSREGAVLREIDTALDTTTVFTGQPSTIAWTVYSVDVELGATKRVTLRAGGAQLAQATLAGTTYGTYGANVGLSSELTTQYVARFDDLILDLR